MLPTRVQVEYDRAAILLPATLFLYALILALVLALKLPLTFPQGAAPFAPLLPFPNVSLQDADWFLTSNANALVLLAITVALTCAFVLLFVRRAKYTMYGMLFAAMTLCWGCFPYYFLVATGVSVDVVSTVLVLWNFTCVGLVVVYLGDTLELNKPWERRLAHFYVLVGAAVCCWPFFCFPEPTLWLFIFWVTIWDLFAVLAPCGPLAWALRVHQQRMWMADTEMTLPHGLVLSTPLFDLGVGDFVFFGVIVGRGALRGVVVFCACASAIAMGLVLTVMAARILDRTIPALPIAMFVAIVVYAWSAGADLTGMSLAFGRSLVFV